MHYSYNREFYLKEQFNNFFIEKFNLPVNDYYSNLDSDGFLQLKSVLSNINNIFTLKVSLAFINWISNKLNFDTLTTSQITQQLNEIKPNANGYDVELTEPLKVVAEVKCNLPVNGGRIYGAAQKKGIKDDIHYLINGKSKSNIDPQNYFKFMVFLDKPEIREATRHLVKNLKTDNKQIVFVDESTSINSTDCVYVVFVGI